MLTPTRLPTKEKAKKKDTPGRALRETVLLLGFAILLALVVKTFFIQSFYIPSESMEPGLVVNDRILVQKPSYWNGEPQRGDVIVFDDPGNWLNGLQNPQPQNILARALSKIGLYPTGGHLVKRVIGVEGDVIVCCDEQGRLSVNGVADRRERLPAETAAARSPATGRCRQPVRLDRRARCPKDSLFVMGDNRANSADSSVHICRKDVDCDPDEGYVPDRPGRRQGLRPRLAARPGGVRRPRRLVRGRPRPLERPVRTIGLVGGMSWHSTLEYYRVINERVAERRGGHASARIVLESLDFEEIRACQTSGDWERAGRLLAEAARTCESVRRRRRAHLRQPHAPGRRRRPGGRRRPAPAHRGRARRPRPRDGWSRLGLVGTWWVMDEEFYADRLRAAGLTVDVPSPEDKVEVDRIIFEELTQGRVLDGSRAAYVEVIRRLQDAGADALASACTELEMLVGPG